MSEPRDFDTWAPNAACQAMAYLDAHENDLLAAFEAVEQKIHQHRRAPQSQFDFWLSVAESLTPEDDPKLWN